MKKTIFILMAFLAISSAFAQKAKSKIPGSKTAINIQSNYMCPMHPDIKSDKPGKCPKCNMDLTYSKKEQMKQGATKTYTCPMHTEVVSDMSGNCPKCKSTLILSAKEQMKMGAMKYTCPMHPHEVSGNPGKCPTCGMELAKAKERPKAKS